MAPAAVLILAAVTTTASTGQAASRSAPGLPSVVVILEGLSWEWLQAYGLSGEFPALRTLLSEAALATFNPLNPSAVGNGAVASYMTLATGVRHDPLDLPVAFAWNTPQTAAVYLRRMGRLPPAALPASGPGQALPSAWILNWPGLVASALAHRTADTAAPGWAVSALRAHGVPVRVAGDSRWAATGTAGSVDGMPSRWERYLRGEPAPLSLAALLGAGTDGTVAEAYPLERRDPSCPAGLCTDWDAAARIATGARDGLTVIASGDLVRVAAESQGLTPQALDSANRRVALGLERFLERWQQAAADRAATRRETAARGSGDLLLVAVRALPMLQAQQPRLTPLVWWSPEHRGPALLYAPTTRRAGLVTAADLMPTWAAAAGAPLPAGLSGRILQRVAPPRGLAQVDRLVRFLQQFTVERGRIYGLRAPVLRSVITALVGALAVLLLTMGPGRGPAWLPDPTRNGGAVRRLLAAWAAAVPLALLVPLVDWLPPAALAHPSVVVAAHLAVAGAIGWVAVGVARTPTGRQTGETGEAGRGLGPVGVVAAATVVAVTFDALRGAPWIARSFMGYDLTAGARFYGIGNEHAGLFTGSLLVVATAAVPLTPATGWRRLGRVTAGMACMVTVSLLLGAPPVGANVGETLAAGAALTAFGVAWRRLISADLVPAGAGRTLSGPIRPQAPWWRRGMASLAWGLAIGVILVAGMGMWDRALPAAMRSHWGQALVTVQEAGPGYLVDLGWRKLALNARLIRYSVYTRALVAATVVLIVAFWRPAEKVRASVTQARRRAYLLLEGAAAGALVALVVNDSGVVAAAMTLLLPALQVLEWGDPTMPAGSAGIDRRRYPG